MRTPIAIVVRRLEPGDGRFIRFVAAEAFADYDGDASGTRTLAMATSRGAHTLIAEVDARPAGFAIVHVDRGRAHLSAIAVERAARGRGVGPRLLRAVERLAVAHGAGELRLETGEANLLGIELFVRAGYVRHGRVTGYYRTGYDALQYRKALDPAASASG